MITVYSKNDCVQCKMTKRFLDQHQIPFKEINLDEQPEFIEHVKNLGFSAAPVIETKTESFSGFQPSKLKHLVSA
ncbi:MULTISPECIES: glutaredoxin-like protein NrdH [unclassified Streptococcus]|uniref:glutaredoxin-like protein NrdH n=1 Tax=unclassified Streptococcus TaxID=2608887 RepID=UPI001071AF37|nr:MULTISPECIES: glutaredoxin-like protein NrdH [unclassified Streptococcus]MBF0787482.1 glutaredoxin-like protein NrdH [Streptococcus sp. 19428wC2_LYSM12]MCQ9212042.1 glutaredoxin-like protein NrdH [Streptococcus sp. B01]MCQ9213371.1 glutaredoxin-like protein NrdH [Streptococcus sp. O1]TFV05565.1 glutaredoxin-like protein NrdH [Streptococcus sp. LYSM12]